MQTDTTRNGTNRLPKVKAIEPEALPPHPDTMMRWATRIFLGLGSLSGLAAALGTGGTFGVLLALVAGGQATAAVLLSRE